MGPEPRGVEVWQKSGHRCGVSGWSLPPGREAGGWGPGPNDSHIQHLAFWLVRRGGNQEQGMKEWGLQSRAQVFLWLRVWDII